MNRPLSDAVPQHVLAQNLLVKVSSALLNVTPMDFEETMTAALAEVADLYGLDCGAIFQVEDAGDTAVVTYIWSADATRTRDLPHTTLPLTEIPRLLDHLQTHQPLEMNWEQPLAGWTAELPHLAYTGCTSALILPIFYRKILVGALFLGRWRPAVHWEPEHVQQIQLFTDLFVAGLARTRSEQTLRDHAADLEMRVAQRTAELQEANHLLHLALRAKDEFLSTMSHELRTPLNAIIGLSQALKEQIRGPLNERQLHGVAIIEQSGFRLLNLINNILELAKLETGALKMAKQTILIQDFCEECLTLVRQKALRKNITLTYEQNIPTAALETDPQWLRKILMHLLNNALAFTDPGGHITLTAVCDTDANQINLALRDTGVGMDTADLARIFQPFVQLDSSLSRQHDGAGLGLALVHKLTTLLGGQIAVESTPQVGTLFTLSFPWAPLPQIPIPSAPATMHNTVTVLLLEQNEAHAAALLEIGQLQGFDIIHLPRGTNLLPAIEQYRPKLLMLDGHADTLNQIRHIRHRYTTADLPILVTATTQAGQDEETYIQVGANAFLPKPYTLMQLMQVFHSYRSLSQGPP